MRKDESGVKEYAKHTRNAGAYSKRGVNKRARKNAKINLQRQVSDVQ